jgi:hypothetical protein
MLVVLALAYVPKLGYVIVSGASGGQLASPLSHHCFGYVHTHNACIIQDSCKTHITLIAQGNDWRFGGVVVISSVINNSTGELTFDKQLHIDIHARWCQYATAQCLVHVQLKGFIIIICNHKGLLFGYFTKVIVKL